MVLITCDLEVCRASLCADFESVPKWELCEQSSGLEHSNPAWQQGKHQNIVLLPSDKTPPELTLKPLHSQLPWKCFDTSTPHLTGCINLLRVSHMSELYSAVVPVVVCNPVPPGDNFFSPKCPYQGMGVNHGSLLTHPALP